MFHSTKPLGLLVSGEDRSCGEGLLQVGQHSATFFFESSCAVVVGKEALKKLGYPGVNVGVSPGKNPEYVGTANSPLAEGAEEYGLRKGNPPVPIGIVDDGPEGKKFGGVENPGTGTGSTWLWCRGLGTLDTGDALGLAASEEVSLTVFSASGSFVLRRSSIACKTSPPFRCKTTFKILLFSRGNTRARISIGDFFLFMSKWRISLLGE